MSSIGSRFGIKSPFSRSGTVSALERMRDFANQTDNAVLPPVATFSLYLLIAFMGLHYVPTRLHPDRILQPLDRIALQSNARGSYKGLNSLWSATQLKHGYVDRKTDIELRFNLANGQTVDVIVTRCARLWLIEVFYCRPLARSRITIDSRKTRKRLSLDGAGYYRFQTVSEAEGHPPVVWRRLMKKPASIEAGSQIVVRRNP